MARQLTHIDFSAGPGGICLGLKMLMVIEYIKGWCDTYQAKHPEEGVDFVTSGVPCETFSTAGNTSHSFYDDRLFLFSEGIRIT